MTAISDRAIVLHRERSGETSLALRLLCRASGRVDALAKGVLHSSFAAASALDLLQEVDVVFKRPARGGRAWIHEAQLVEPFAGLRRDLGRLDLACYFGSLVGLCVDQDHPAPEIYDLLRLALGHMDNHDASLKAMLRFELRLLQLLGLAPVTGDVPPARFVTIFVQNFHALPPARSRLLHELGPG